MALIAVVGGWQCNKIWHVGEQVTEISYSKQISFGCFQYAHEHEECFPSELEQLVPANLINASFFQKAMRLGRWDYRGMNHKTTDPTFLLATLHVGAGLSGSGKEYWIKMTSDGSVNVAYRPPAFAGE